MKICFYKNSAGGYNAEDGGVQRISRVLSEELTLLGFEVLYLSTASTKAPAQTDVHFLPDVEIATENNISALHTFLKEKEIDVFLNHSGFNDKTLRLLAGVPEDVKVISVHHNCIRCLYERYADMFRINRGALINRVVNTFGLWWLVKRLYLVRNTFLWNKMLGLSDAAVLYFESFAEELYDLNGIKSEKIKIITNPSPFDLKEEASERFSKNIVYVGRIEENQKRIDRLLTLWSRLHQAFPDWTFDMVGDGSYLSTAKAKAKELGLDRITFHGKQDPLPYWDKADLFTLTSDFEGFGMVLMEAQSRGVVPITFNCFSAVHQLVNDNVSGYIINDFDEEEMFEKTAELMRDVDKLRSFKQNAVKSTGPYDRKVIAQKWVDLFNEINGDK